jgi:predicted phage terminase large subunit-like protein
VPGWHLDAIAEHLEAVSAGQIRFLIISMPPRCMKSTSVGVMWPVWDWLRRPWRQFLSVSYAQSLATRDAVKARRIIQSPWFQQTFGDRFQLTSDQNAKERYDNDRGGYRIATAVDAKLTGEGGDFIVIDDPLNAKDKDSETVREGTSRWFDEAAASRLNDLRTGAFMLVMQRLHERDLAGHVLRRELDGEGGREVVHLCLPARYEPDHPYVYARDPRKTPGELLWPARFPERELRRLERQLGAYAAASQLQQRPAPREGGMFDKGKVIIVEALPAQKYRRVRAWDLAGSIKTTQKPDPDYTVGIDIRIGEEDGLTYVVDVERGRWTPEEVEKRIVATASRDGAGTPIWLPQDPGQAGLMQAGHYIRKLAGYRAKARPVTGDKVVRANPLSAQWSAGNVRLVRGPWNDALLDEFAMFPNGAHDDQVDAVAAGYNDLVEPMTGLLEFYEQRAGQVPEEPKQNSWIVHKIHYGPSPDDASGGNG